MTKHPHHGLSPHLARPRSSPHTVKQRAAMAQKTSERYRKAKITLPDTPWAAKKVLHTKGPNNE